MEPVYPRVLFGRFTCLALMGALTLHCGGQEQDPLEVSTQAQALHGGVTHAREVQGFGSHLVNVAYPVEGTPILDHFFLDFRTTDHHIQQIGLIPKTNRTLDILYHDSEPNDRYFYNIRHLGVNDSRITRGTLSDFCLGSCPRQISIPSGYAFALVGFRMFFIGDRDRHMDQVGILENGGRVTITYRDKKVEHDDTFFYEVHYALIPGSRVGSRGTLSGANVKGADSRNYAPVGIPTIGGFFFNFRDNDHHLRDIGVMTQPSRVEVYYEDKDPDDYFNWQVNWVGIRDNAILQPLPLDPNIFTR